MQGEVLDGDLCDACQTTTRPWTTGTAPLLYDGRARQLVHALKYQERRDVITPAARWMAQEVRDTLDPKTLIVPVPMHWRRLVARRIQASAVLAVALGHQLGLPQRHDILTQTRATRSLKGLSHTERFAETRGAFAVAGKHARRIAGRPVLLVDDFMASGATLTACAEVLLASRASEVHVTVLARADREAYVRRSER